MTGSKSEKRALKSSVASDASQEDTTTIIVTSNEEPKQNTQPQKNKLTQWLEAKEVLRKKGLIPYKEGDDISKLSPEQKKEFLIRPLDTTDAWRMLRK